MLRTLMRIATVVLGSVFAAYVFFVGSIGLLIYTAMVLGAILGFMSGLGLKCARALINKGVEVIKC